MLPSTFLFLYGREHHVKLYTTNDKLSNFGIEFDRMFSKEKSGSYQGMWPTEGELFASLPHLLCHVIPQEIKIMRDISSFCATGRE